MAQLYVSQGNCLSSSYAYTKPRVLLHHYGLLCSQSRLYLHDLTHVHHISLMLFSQLHMFFIRHDAVRASPFKVIKRGNKSFKLLIDGRHVHVLIDQLKPAFLDSTTYESDPLSLSSTQDTAVANETIPTSLPPSPSNTPTSVSGEQTTTTRSEHRVHWPRHLFDYC